MLINIYDGYVLGLGCILITKKSSLIEWLDYIQNLNSTLIDLNLERIRLVADNLNLLPLQSYIILVGGTNGKGTTCCLLESVLLSNNIKVGLYTSPHLLSYNERIRVCGKELPDYMHTQAMYSIEQVRDAVPLTYFEFITLSAFYLFKQFRLDVIILEVGLGGRLDATNLIDADISVITNVAIDHVDFLGNTRDKIAIEKSGIFRSHRIAVVGEINRPVIMDEIAKYQKTVLFARGRDWNFFYYKNTWIWIAYNYYSWVLYNLPWPHIPIENAAIVLGVLYWMPFPIFKKSICYGLRNANLPGRLQIINKKPLVILDVGHNPNAAQYVSKRLAAMVSNESKVRLVIGMLKNKDIKNTICYLSNIVDIWYYADLNVSMSMTIMELSSYFVNFNARYFDSIVYAWYQAITDSDRNDCVLVFGSFYAISPILKLVINNNDSWF